MTMVWKASKAQAIDVRTKCLNCQYPNSPQYLRSITSMQRRSTGGSWCPSRRFLSSGGMRGDRRLSGKDREGVWVVIGVAGVCYYYLLWGGVVSFVEYYRSLKLGGYTT
ncbi:hypothetical protein HanPI659440_Chr13g0502851 [Helianthus annuus]|nr:hypothetical protein HanPI659440_Chr13g0502851 [Helianthus annuus]